MCPVAESLIFTGRCMLLAAHKLQVQPENLNHREELAAAAKRILTETVKVTAERDGARAGWDAALCECTDAEGTGAALHQDRG